MSGQKESPRQKMVGMMYLVLTALLALNISKDVLDAFIVVNNGLENTNTNFSNRNDELYAEFNLAKSVDAVRVTPNWEKAQLVKKHAATLIGFIDTLKTQLVAETDGIELAVADTLNMEYIKGKDNYDITTNIMIGDSEDGSTGVSLELKNRLIAYKTLLQEFILPSDRAKISLDINTEDPKVSENNENWELYNFFHRPLVASITILSKMKNDIKNAESTIVDYLLKQADAGNLKFDTVAAKVIPQSNYVLLGEDYKADLFLAAFNKTKNPEVEVGNYNAETHLFEGPSTKVEVENGVGKYRVSTSKEGVFDYSGTLKMVAPSGKEILFPFKSEYIVAKPALTVSAEKMNVFYDGLDNPVSISVPGVPNERLKVTIDKGRIQALGNGRYMVRVSTDNGAKAKISVTAIMESGEQKNMGISEFRVKRIPKPVSRYAGKTEGGVISIGELKANKYLIAAYENFEFDLISKVSSFTISGRSKGVDFTFGSDNNKLPDDFYKIVEGLKRGNKLYFENIRAKGADGRIVPLSPLSFILK